MRINISLALFGWSMFLAGFGIGITVDKVYQDAKRLIEDRIYTAPCSTVISLGPAPAPAPIPMRQKSSIPTCRDSRCRFNLDVADEL